MGVNAEFSHRREFAETSFPLILYPVVIIWRLIQSSYLVLSNYAHTVVHWLVLWGVFFSRLKDSSFNRLLIVIIFCITLPGFAYETFPHFYWLIPNLEGLNTARFADIFPFFYILCLGFAIDQIPKHSTVHFDESIDFPIKPIVCSLILILFIYPIIKTPTPASDSFYYYFENERFRNLVQKMNEAEMPFRVVSDVFRAGGDRFFDSSIAMAYGLESTNGYLTIYPERYKKFWLALTSPLKEIDSPRYKQMRLQGNALQLVPYGLTNGPVRLRDYCLTNLLSLANTRYIISKDQILDDEYRLVSHLSSNQRRGGRIYDAHKIEVKPAGPWNLLKNKIVEKLEIEQRWLKTKSAFSFEEQIDDLYLYENTDYIPRFFVASTARYFESSTDLLEHLGNATISELKKTAFLELENLSEKIQFSVQDRSIELVRYTPDSIELSVDLDGTGLLIVSNSYSPFWQVHIDDHLGEIIPVNHAFWGVVLNNGSHQVTFTYNPPYRL